MKYDKKKKAKWLSIDFICVLILIALDQFTKSLAIGKLKGQDAFPLIENIFELDYVENRGAAFGLYQDRKILLLIIGTVFMIAVIMVLVRIPLEKKYMIYHFTVASILAGGFGNMLDRIIKGYVVDFFSFVLIHFPVFNVADIYITLSCIGLLALHLFVYSEDDLLFLIPKKKMSEQ